MRVVGIDTDSKGSIAVIDTDARTVSIYYIPSTLKTLTTGTKRAVLVHTRLALHLQDVFTRPVDAVYIEEQWSRPNQDVAATFTFGSIYGSIEQAVHSAALCAGQVLKLRAVHSTIWKNALRLDNDGKKKKTKALNLATTTFPLCATAWDRTSLYTSAAEATLIAFYGLVKERGPGLSGTELRRYDLNLRTPERETS